MRAEIQPSRRGDAMLFMLGLWVGVPIGFVMAAICGAAYER